jgi:hypothetical protein
MRRGVDRGSAEVDRFFVEFQALAAARGCSVVSGRSDRRMKRSSSSLEAYGSVLFDVVESLQSQPRATQTHGHRPSIEPGGEAWRSDAQKLLSVEKDEPR